MSVILTQYGAQQALTVFFGSGFSPANPMPSTWYVGLMGVYSGGGAPPEVSGTNYARVSVANNLTTFSTANLLSVPNKTNQVAVTFPTAGGTGWGDIGFWGVWDAASGGNLWAYGPLTSFDCYAGDTPSLAVGSMNLGYTAGTCMTTFSKAGMLDLFFGGQVPGGILVSGYYVGLLSSGTTEVSGSNYSRVNYSNNSTNWGVSGGYQTNKNQITFPSPTGTWSSIGGIGLYDGSSGGDLIFAIPLGSGGGTPGSGDTVEIPAGGIQINP